MSLRILNSGTVQVYFILKYRIASHSGPDRTLQAGSRERNRLLMAAAPGASLLWQLYRAWKGLKARRSVIGLLKLGVQPDILRSIRGYDESLHMTLMMSGYGWSVGNEGGYRLCVRKCSKYPMSYPVLIGICLVRDERYLKRS
jgi:hypothetical protein